MTRSENPENAYAGPIQADAFVPGPDDQRLKIGIIGAGIAGLAAAVALRHSGHKVESEFMRANDLETIIANETKGFPERYGAEFYFMHRVDLHNELRRLAEESDGRTEPVKIILSADVVGADPGTGQLVLNDGTKYKKDVIVAADGVHSFLTSKILGTENAAYPTGQSAFRFLIPTEKLLQDPEARLVVQGRPDGIYVVSGSDRRLVWYPCRGGEVMNFVGIHPDEGREHSTEDFTASAPVEELLHVYESFHPSLRAMCRNADDVKLWKLLFRPPIHSFTKDKLVLVGDAAHPMLPHQGQAGAQAIEDGAALGALLSKLKSIDEIQTRLKAFDEIRRNRASAMQIFSNAGQDQAERIEKEAEKYVEGPVPKNPHEFHEWNFSYDVFRHSLNALSAIS
ncbi:MAG: hypothetical protein M1820_009752 [Bogoriella megaspora]|nr:MAG: hypothetical protein M1820_009752 [Bogoriella megaspora]